MRTILLLIGSNIFMTVAWYGHLKHTGADLWKVILVSWLIALPEYCLQVPANRIGSDTWSVVELKVLQEAITLVVFAGFVMAYFGIVPRWNHLVAFALVLGAVAFAFMGDISKALGR